MSNSASTGHDTLAAEIEAEIEKWARRQPEWLQYLIGCVARPVTAETLIAPAEADRVLAALSSPTVASEALARPQPEHLGSNLPGASPVRLLALSDPCRVNQLMPGQTLRFGQRGLTAVFGLNGSGKSGFARVLRRLGRTRRSRSERACKAADTIHPDVYAEPAPQPGSAEITVEFCREGDPPSEVRWREGVDTPLRASMCVFDSHAAPVYVDEESTLDFVPHGLDLFDRLAEALHEVQGRAEARIRALETACDQLRVPVPPGTAAERFQAQLDHRSNQAELRQWTTWTEADERRFRELEVALVSTDLLASLVAARQQLARLRAECERLAEAVSDPAIDRVRRLHGELVEAETTRDQLAQACLATRSLQGVGSRLWRTMYAAARAYAAEALPAGSFPPAAPGEPCVLCQQPLDEHAIARFAQFEALAMSDAGRAAQQARARLETAVREVRDAVARPVITRVSQHLERLESPKHLLRKALRADEAARALARVAGRRAAALTQAAGDGRWPGDWDALPDWASELATFEAALVPALTLAEAASRDRAGMARELEELRGRRALAHANDALLAIQARRREISALREAQRGLRTSAVSQARRTITEGSLQRRIETLLGQELEALRLSHLVPRFVLRGDRGRALTRIHLAGARNSTRLGEVLSEGEQRGLALACFLAEVQMVASASTIALDDPVSSMDHDRRTIVARRLAELARERQVIVFTHDLVFLHALEEQAEIADAQFSFQYVERRRRRGAGLVSNNPPFHYKNLRGRINELRDALATLARAYESESPDYGLIADGLHSRLRGCWERAVESVLFGGVVTRFQHAVKTRSLKGVPIPRRLKRMIDAGMGALSRHRLHDEADAVVAETWTPEVFAQRLGELEAFVAAVKECAREFEEQDRSERALAAPDAPKFPSTKPAYQGATPARGRRRTTGGDQRKRPPKEGQHAKVRAGFVTPPDEQGPTPATAVRGTEARAPVNGPSVSEAPVGTTGAESAAACAAFTAAWEAAEAAGFDLEKCLTFRARNGEFPYALLGLERGPAVLVASEEELEARLERRDRQRSRPGEGEPRLVLFPERDRCEAAICEVERTATVSEDGARSARGDVSATRAVQGELFPTAATSVSAPRRPNAPSRRVEGSVRELLATMRAHTGQSDAQAEAARVSGRLASASLDGEERSSGTA